MIIKHVMTIMISYCRGIHNGGWNPSDGKNQTGWAVMLDKMKEEDVNLIVSAGDQVEDQSWGKSSEYAVDQVFPLSYEI